MKKILLLISLLVCGYNVFAENEATLKNIKVNNTTCLCNGFECTIEIDANSANITYELNDPDAKVDRLSGFSTDLISDSTTMKVTVTNDKGEEKIENIYTIVINKHQKSNDVSLKEFGVNDEDIPLLEEVFVYSATVKYDAEVLKFKMVPNNNGASVVSSLEHEFSLDKSSLAIDLEVKAENGEKKTYRVVVYRSEKPDTSLKKLVVANNEIELKKDKLEYDVVVDYSIVSLDVKPEVNNDKATFEIVKEDLVVGENEVKIIVKNENATSEYFLHVIREENKDKSIANLKKLVIDEYSKLNFEENVLEYNLRFKEIPNKLTIKATPVTKDAVVQILYNEDLSNKDKILIRVSIDDTDISREYVLTVIQDDDANDGDNKTFTLISLIIVALMTIGLGILEIRNNKRARKLEITRIIELKKKKDKAKEKIKEKLMKDKKSKQPKKKEEEDELEII